MNSNITLISWNVNGLRSVLRKGDFMKFIKKYSPDILCLQETKAARHQVELDLPDYEEYWNSAEKKGYSGVAIFSKTKPVAVFDELHPGVRKTKKLLDDQGRDALTEGRILTAEFKNFFVVSVYTPNAKDGLGRLAFRHKKWDPLFLKHCLELQKKKPVVFCGDLNVAHKEIDLARPKENIGKHGFTNEERSGFDNFLKAGFIDTLREKAGDRPGLYTWWTHWANARARNIGWRIDYVLISKKLKKGLNRAFILPEVMGSDHCPVGIEIEI